MNKETLNKLKELFAAMPAAPHGYSFGSRYVARKTDNSYEYVAECPAGTEDTLEWEKSASLIMALLNAAPDLIALAERTTSPVSQMTDATIREIFMAHGFTIKEGQTDLKPYVYAAARALLSAAPAAPVAEPAPAVGSSMWSLIDEYARAKAVYEYSTDRDEADRQRKERDAAKEALQAALAAQPQPVCRHYECRRYCKGDGEWTDWTVCSDEYFRLNKDDRSFEFRIAASQQAAEPVARKIVAWTEKDGDEWVVYDAESDTGQHIAKYQTKDHGVHVFPIYEDCKP